MHLGDILDIMSERAGGLTLHESMHIARSIMELHSAGLETAKQAGYTDGYENGTKDTEYRLNFELDKLRRLKVNAESNATELVKDIVKRIGSHKKIQVIKELRNATGLGLKETKDIVDAYCLRLDRMELMDYQRAAYDAAYQPF